MFAHLNTKGMFSHLKAVASFSARPFRPDVQDLIEDNYGPQRIGIGIGQGVAEFSKSKKE